MFGILRDMLQLQLNNQLLKGNLMTLVQATNARYINVRFDGFKAEIVVNDSENTTIVLPVNLWSVNSLRKQLASLAEVMEQAEKEVATAK